MRRYIKIYRLLIAQYIKSLMQSKTDFWIGFLGFFVTQAAGIAFIYFVFQQIPNLAGWSLYEIIFIYGFAQIPRGIDHIFTDYIWILSSRLVVRGEVDRYLVRPLNPLFQICAERFQQDGIGELAIGFICIVIASLQLQLSFNLLTIFIFFVAVIFGSIIYTSIKLFFASLAFWIKDSIGLLQIAYNSSDFTKYPIDIYGKGIRLIISYIIPFAFCSFYPAAFFLNRLSFSESILIEIIVAIVGWLLAYSVFKLGIRSYESAGN